MSGPYLVSDPYTPENKPESFEVILNGMTYQSSPVAEGTGGFILKFDLDGKWKQGQNDITVSAVNAWGQSEKVPFVFIAGIPLAPSNLTIRK